METKQRLTPRHCPRCGGPTYVDEYDAASCLLCGEYIFIDRQGQAVPPPAAGPRRRQRQRRAGRATVAA